MGQTGPKQVKTGHTKNATCATYRRKEGGMMSEKINSSDKTSDAMQKFINTVNGNWDNSNLKIQVQYESNFC